MDALKTEKTNIEKIQNDYNSLEIEKNELINKCKKEQETVSEIQLNLKDLRKKYQSLIEKDNKTNIDFEKEKMKKY